MVPAIAPTDPPASSSTPEKSAAPGAKPKRAKSKSRKSGAPKTKRTAPKKIAGPRNTIEPSDDDIRLRAYFIAERRINLSLPGDSAQDWIEALRQLREAGSSGDKQTPPN